MEHRHLAERGLKRRCSDRPQHPDGQAESLMPPGWSATRYNTVNNGLIRNHFNHLTA